ncbi:MAG: cation diffusion facilitator family transporter [Pirellulaceae bacterium]
MHMHHGGSDHSHPPPTLNRSFALAVVLNVLLVFGEGVGGLVSGSVALLADAGHNLSDVAGLILAWWAHWLRGKPHRGRWTYGWRSFTILAANVNGILLVVAIVGVSLESIRRLMVPTEILEVPVLVVALIAALLNFGTAKLLSHGHSDLNVRGAYLHMLADAVVSLAVVVGAIIIMLTEWLWLDAAISLAICVVLAFGTWGLLRESTTMLMHAAPREIDVDEVRNSLLSHALVSRVDDLHVWSVSTTDVLLTATLVCPELNGPNMWQQHDRLLHDLHAGLEHDFSIAHATLEITYASAVDDRQSRQSRQACPLNES